MTKQAAISMLLRYMAGLPSQTRERGEALYECGSVEEVDFDLEEACIWGKVEGSRSYVYETELFLDAASGNVFGECSCPVGLRCKHSYALAQAAHGLLKGKVGEQQGKPLLARQEVVQQIREAVNQRNQGKRLGVSLEAYIHRAARIWPDYQRTKVLWWFQLRDFTDIAFYDGKQRELEEVKLINDGPIQTPLQLFDSLLFSAVYHDLDPPAQLIDQAVLDEQFRRFKAANRVHEIEQWKNRFGKLSQKLGSSEPAVQAQSVDVRLVLASPKWFFEAGIEEKWRKLTPQYARKMGLDDLTHALPKLTQEAAVFYGPFLAIEKAAYEMSSQQTSDREQLLNQLLRMPISEGRVFTRDRRLVRYEGRSLSYRVKLSEGEHGVDAHLNLVDEGKEVTRTDAICLPADPANGIPGGVIVDDVLYDLPESFQEQGSEWMSGIVVPWDALKSTEGVSFLRASGTPVPDEIEESIRELPLKAVLRVVPLMEDWDNSVSALEFILEAVNSDGEVMATYAPEGWSETSTEPSEGSIPLLLWEQPAAALRQFLSRSFNPSYRGRFCDHFNGAKFAELSDWLQGFPKHTTIQLPAEYASLLQASPKAGFHIQIEQEETRRDWFNISAELDAGDIELSKEEIDLLVEARGRFVFLKGKGYQRIEIDTDEQSAELMEQMGIEPGSDVSQTYHSLQLQAWSDSLSVTQPEGWDACVKRMKRIQSYELPSPPDSLASCLRPYQEDGFKFLSHLSHWGLGGILADDMGLGKTLQALTWLVWLKSLGKAESPFRVLVVCPKSVIDNWLTEPGKFNTGLKSGCLDKDMVNANQQPEDLLVINYTQLRMHADYLTAIEWDAAILDEGQYIKNPGSKTAQSAFALKAKHRVVLTGTPVENRLLDLWSLMRFAMPGLLENQTRFKKRYNEKRNPDGPSHIARRIRPFILRRSKQQVAQDLPERIEEEIHCELEGKQRKLYDAELKVARQALLRAKDDRQFNKQRFSILQSLLRMRQICCDPRLIHAGLPSTTPSAKMESLMDLIEPLVDEGNKVLIFSQFVTQLELISAVLVKKGIAHLSLTGKTQNRGALVERFQKTDTEAVFLLSLKAAGSGLNLTAASYVVLYDPWWNPAVEAQAIDRTHRIGQTSKVIAYRIIAKNTIEEKIRTLQLEKSQLADTVVQEESLTQVLDLENLRKLLQ